VRELWPLAAFALLCTAVARSPFACAGPPPAGDPRGASEAASAKDDAALAALAARGASGAPGMRESSRLRSTGDKVVVARARDRDACVRVAFDASAPVLAKLLDTEGHVLASLDAPAMGGVLGARGPVCVRKGDAVSAVAAGPDGGAGSVRWVAWQSP
jgi:hypothetical protein